MKRTLVLITAGLVAFLLQASLAAAQIPIERGYGGQAGAAAEVEAGAGGGGGGLLPFTGLDIGLLVGGGMVLLLAGAAIRRLARE